MSTQTEQRVEDQKSSVCAWCRSEYDKFSGVRGQKLSDTEYAAVLSHGICNDCKTALVSERS